MPNNPKNSPSSNPTDVQLIEQLAFSVDVIGSSNVTTDRISIDVPEFGADAFDTSPPSPSGFTRISRNLSTDIIDLSLGFKLSLFKSVIGFVNFFVPLNTDGLRADFIPTAGLEVSF